MSIARSVDLRTGEVDNISKDFESGIRLLNVVRSDYLR